MRIDTWSIESSRKEVQIGCVLYKLIMLENGAEIFTVERKKLNGKISTTVAVYRVNEDKK